VPDDDLRRHAQNWLDHHRYIRQAFDGCRLLPAGKHLIEQA
jgi:hypothetical protein